MSLRQSVGDITCTLVSIVRTRLELFSLEASQQKASLIKLLGLLFGAILFSTLALLVFSLLIALLFWPTEYRYWAIAVLIVVYGALGLGMFLAIVNRLNKGPYPFAATIAELRRDVEVVERLRGSSSNNAGDS
ncbi:phage holin family protein [Paenalcaligenes niemegkensis]|uniref:phage holin family protein n=1 Tax=Paenalcaligenes niemegkensis TaxID=2895469 RepID=UPI001EE98BF3|nr:phage holin family protein [Paenalcaligenes niemegkensis]MCQ9617156.1 phage holin family protein [Paenalcaligenes niemegkensis]